MKYDVIIGLDFGHGEVAAIASRSNHPEDYMPLSLTQDRDKVIPTVIHYDENGTVSIGNNAANKEGMITYFKTSPGLWTLKNGDPVQLKGHNIRDITCDFYRELMKNILTYNTDSALKEGDSILLVAGCPASPDWTDDENKKAYEQLIREATGIPNVSVVPESRGAIFSAYSGRTLKGVNAKDGIAVFDFGSLTADFTYIKMGEMLMERSWDLGASQVEKAMLRKILKIGGKTHRDIYRDQECLLLHKLRREKEMYYSGTLMVEHSSIDLICTDELGDPIMEQNRLGRIRMKKTEIRYPEGQSDMDEFMADVVEKETFEILQNGTSIGTYSWHDGCKAFYTAMKNLLESKNLPCRMIVLTGGASRMPFVREVAKEVFTDTEIVVEENPSITVARGLCIIGDIDRRVVEIMNQDRVMLYDQGKNFFLQMADSVSRLISENAVDSIARYLSSVEGDITVGELKASVENNIVSLLETPKIRDRISQTEKEMLDNIVAAVVRQANEAGGRLYRNQATLEIFRIDSREVSRMLSSDMIGEILQTDLSKIIKPEEIVGLVVMKVVSAVLVIISIALLFVNPLLGLGMLVAEDLMEKTVTKFYTRNPNRVLTADKIAKARDKYEKGRDGNVEEMRKSITESIWNEFKKSAQMQSAVDRCVDACITRAYGIVAMQTFEQENIQ